MEDLDATRRTTRPAVDDETRRTHPCRRRRHPADRDRDEAEPAPDPQNWPPNAAGRRPVFSESPREFGVLMLALVHLAGLPGNFEYLLYQHGQQLERDIQAEQVTDPERHLEQMDGTFQGAFLRLCYYADHASW